MATVFKTVVSQYYILRKQKCSNGALHGFLSQFFFFLSLFFIFNLLSLIFLKKKIFSGLCMSYAHNQSSLQL
jgi:hypothetical protein